MVNRIKNKLFEEVVFFIALGFAILTGFFAKFNFVAIDFNVLGILLVLMLITLAFEKYELLDYIAVWVLSKADSERKTAFAMVFLTAALAMFITNDVALITVVPISMTLSRKAGFNPFKLVVLEALAANIGSSLMPFGNPQNLYLYTYFHYNFVDFISAVASFVILGMLLLLFPISRLSKAKFDKVHLNVEIESKKWLSVYMFLFFTAVFLIIFRINILYALVPVLVCVLIKDLDLFKQLDYFLLGTFVCFFIFVDHVNQFVWIKEIIHEMLRSDSSIFLSGAILSQGISNVPAAILLSTFVSAPDPLLIGVSVGGLGTMIASLANLIAYKYYAKQYDIKKYHRYFVKLNVALLAFFLVFFYWVLN